MSPIAHRLRPRHAAFTLVELLVTASLSVVLGGIIYTAGSEALTSFARNVSINRSYSDARVALDRIAQTTETAGHTPTLVNADGFTVATTTTANPRAAGIRFYRSDITPSYLIPSGKSSNTTLKITGPAGFDAPRSLVWSP